MARRKTNRKKADETLVDIVEVKDNAQSFVDQNQRLIFGLGIGLIVLVGGYFFYQNLYKAPKEKEAMEQMFKAQEQFERDSFALALTNPGGGYVGFLDIIDSYGGTKASNLANYYAGVSYLNLGQFDDALDYMKSFSPAGHVGPVMKFGVLGDIYSELDQMDNAMSNYKKAINSGENEVLTAYYRGGGIVVIANQLFDIANQNSIETEQKSDPCEDSPCSPFCICSSCFTALDTVKEIRLPEKILTSSPKNTPSFIQHFHSSSFNPSIWQPPQLG